MSNWGRLKQSWARIKQNPQFQNWWSSPVTKIVAINSGVFVLMHINIAFVEIEAYSITIYGQTFLI